MLESFEISNFRLFQHLIVKKLNRVNLIVGKNNSGKSTFLEAVELYISNVSPAVLIELIESRNNDWHIESTSYSQNIFAHPLRHLFFGHKFPDLRQEPISLGEILSEKIYIGLRVSRPINNDEDKTARRFINIDLHSVDDFSDLVIDLVAVENEKTRRVTSFSYEFKHQARTLFDLKYPWQTVSTGNMSNQKLSALWDLTSLKINLKNAVIDALCLIDPRVTGVGFVDDTSKGRDRIPLVTMSGVEEPLPLKSMGDGMTRLFHIILALVNAKNGLLLIDEFENGLHWSVQPKIWNIIFQLAERLNVQVFATTHSRDCIAGFDDAWNNYPELGAFLRLDLKDGIVKATEYSSETLTDAIEMDVEVR